MLCEGLILAGFSSSAYRRSITETLAPASARVFEMREFVQSAVETAATAGYLSATETGYNFVTESDVCDPLCAMLCSVFASQTGCDVPGSLRVAVERLFRAVYATAHAIGQSDFSKKSEVIC